ncbi:CDP-diacylglycerol diphosphatase [Pseudomonas sp. MAFF 212408]|uniref:CDP-diacylglycerol pyrophosphatase n=1 Tax=Pseudomonas kitaguniensis TaxID=2607908 RepID=A0A5N7KF70_9PSED|nr:CDP-diacylglycerol diphosphatase [Pseudomonas kitaguniensis]MPR00826.1 CDP-diacylglycerol diphosphatase [Pseudomonas kitaguniensis]
MKRSTVFKIAGVLLLAAVLVGFWTWRGNPDALWHIVSRQCVPNQQQQQKPDPCLAVDLDRGYVLLKDRQGPLHVLLIAADKITGIEDPALGRGLLPHYVAQAWRHRDVLSSGLARPVPDQYVAVAINSRYGRSQNQLHVHIACLRAEVFAAINQPRNGLDEQWRVLPVQLMGHTYSGRTLSAAQAEGVDPLALLRDYVESRSDAMSQYGLLMASRVDGSVVLLTTQVSLTELNLGSPAELQDYHCGLWLR